MDNVGLKEKMAFKQRLEHGSRVSNSRDVSMRDVRHHNSKMDIRSISNYRS